MMMPRVEKSKSGFPTLYIGDRLIHSAYDPMKEARQEVESIARENPSLIVILGMGLGYTIDAALELAPQAKILVVEADPEIYLLASKVRAEQPLPLIPNLSSDERMTYVVGRNEEANFAAITHCVGPTAAMCVKYVSRLADLDPPYYAEITRTIGRVSAMQLESILSTVAFGMLWWENSVRNHHQWETAPDVADWFGAYRGRPAFIFAAGPSLEDSLDLFAANEGGIRFVVDTAYSTVRTAGIRVDAVFAIDAQLSTLDHFKNFDPDCLIGAPVIPPALWSRARQSMITSLGGPHFEWFDQALGRPVAKLKSGGSVTTFAFDLARRMGADPIVLIGADFAHRKGRRHAGGTSYEASDVATLSRFRPREQSNFHGTQGVMLKDGFETESNLAQYAQWMKWEISDTPAKVYRMADHGLLSSVPVVGKGMIDNLLREEKPEIRFPAARNISPRRLIEAFRAERVTLDAALSGETNALRMLSGFFDPIVRPAALASHREALNKEVLDQLMGQLRQARDILDEVIADASG